MPLQGASENFETIADRINGSLRRVESDNLRNDGANADILMRLERSGESFENIAERINGSLRRAESYQLRSDASKTETLAAERIEIIVDGADGSRGVTKSDQLRGANVGTL